MNSVLCHGLFISDFSLDCLMSNSNHSSCPVRSQTLPKPLLDVMEITLHSIWYLGSFDLSFILKQSSYSSFVWVKNYTIKVLQDSHTLYQVPLTHVPISGICCLTRNKSFKHSDRPVSLMWKSSNSFPFHWPHTLGSMEPADTQCFLSTLANMCLLYPTGGWQTGWNTTLCFLAHWV